MALLRRRLHTRLAAWSLVLLCAGAAAVEPLRAAPSRIVSQQSIYAAFVVNVARFIQWPANVLADPESPLVIGTFERDPINPSLDAAVTGEKIANHPVVSVRIHSLDDLNKCQVVYVSAGDRRTNAVLSRIAGRPILSIGTADGFLALGGQVRFVSQPPHTGLEINVENLRNSGLQARAQLLRLATTR
jgi:YfiR/HmsC-like